MAYQINKTDGTIVATVADGQVDDRSTDITLIGKNYSGFGEIFNENLIKILENFAESTQPDHPLRGQIWFDSSESKLKVYNGVSFVPVSSATISSTQPSTLATGDLWYDDVGEQLFFFDGTSAILLAPAYSSSQSISGLRVDTILDTLNQTRVITSLYNNGILLGIFAKDSFTPKIAITGYTGSIAPGFNVGTLANFKIRATCTNSDSLGGAPATTYVRTDTTNAINGQLQITVDDGLLVGSANNGSLFVTTGDLTLANSSSNKNITFSVNRSDTQENAIVINSNARSIGLYPTIASSTVNLGGDFHHVESGFKDSATWSLKWPETEAAFKEVPIAKKAAEMLRYDDAKQAQWLAADGTRWQLSWFYWKPGQSAGYLAKSHNPLVCMPAAGYEVSSVSPPQSAEVQGLRLPFRIYSFAQDRSTVYILYTRWDDRATEQSFATEGVSRFNRLTSVWRGRGNHGQRVASLAVWGAHGSDEARALLLDQLEKVLAVGGP